MAAAAAGVVAGAVMGVLFAPNKGTHTRKKIADSSKKLATNVKGKISKGKEKLVDFKADMKQLVIDKINGFA